SGPAPEVRPASPARTVPGRSGLWRHKWADRTYLAGAEAGDSTPLFIAGDGTVLETSRGNVFLLRDDGTLVTPPLRDDLLPGVTRRALLDAARDCGRPTDIRAFDVDELMGCVAFWTSSLSGAVPIESVDGTMLPRNDDQVARFAAALVFGGEPSVR
ncbi:MAG: putative para-aminobenzoate synthase component, partial [Pseudonocardiales bacterium]|nr:putative para-aminobenzoate synthase component [Pseudonocardiales bacterium]